MKILITGAGGMLGSDLSLRLQQNHTVLGISRKVVSHLQTPYFSFDLLDQSLLQAVVECFKPDLIFHAAALTDVDGCELRKEEALLQNVQVTRLVADAAIKNNAFLIFFSTDYVFDGRRKGEYDESDLVHPINYYGETKALAEKYIQQHLTKYAIFRISWLYGLYGRSFPRTLLERAKSQKKFEIVNDQIGRPTYTRDIGDFFGRLLDQNENGLKLIEQKIFHLGNTGTASWFDFGRAIFEAAHYENVQVHPLSSDQLKRAAQRPHQSVLSLKRSQELGITLRAWPEALKDFYQEWKEYQQHVR